MKNKLLIIICSLATVSVATAQTSLTLDEFRKNVIEYNKNLQISKEGFKAAEQKVAMVKTGFLPSLSATANANYQVGNTMSFGSMMLKDYNYSANLTLEQKVYAGGAVSAQVAQARIEQNIALDRQEQVLENVVYSADLAYWAFAASAEQMGIAQRYVEIVKELYDIVNVRFNDGYVSKTDLLMVETRLSEAQLQQIEARKLYLNSLQKINTMVGNHKLQEYAVGDSVSRASVVPQMIGLEESLLNRADYRIATLDVDLKKSNIKVMASQYNPQFVVGVQGVFGTPSLNFTGDPKLYGAAYGSLRIPIFSWGERRYALNQVRASVRASQLSQIDQVDIINSELEIAKINLTQYTKQKDVAMQNLDNAVENLSLSTFSYSEGRLPIIDVLQSQLAWIQSYTSLTNTNYGYQVAISEYNKASGEINFK